VVIPTAVQAELIDPDSPIPDWMNPPPAWLRILTPTHIQPDLQLDPGECAAISLALELNADRLLIDERPGRKAAIARRLKVAGTLAVILDASEKKLIDGISTLTRLEQTIFLLLLRYLKPFAYAYLEHEINL